MFQYSLKYLFSISLFFIVCSCTKDRIGPEYIQASSDFNKEINFELVQNEEVSNEVVDFSIKDFDKAHFQAPFNEKVSWKIAITGYSSGAEKIIQGVSKDINQENSLWSYGRSSNIFFFREDEFVKVELNIAGIDTTYLLDSVLFQGEFSWNRKIINNTKYIVVDKFNSADVNPLRGLSATTTDKKDQDVKISISSSVSVEGEYSLFMTGVDLDDNGWIGDKNHERLLELYTYMSVDQLPIDSIVSEDELYFNVFIYGNTDYPSSTIELKVCELDDPNFKTREDIRYYSYGPDENKLTSTQRAISDAWLYDIIVDWDGWKMVSVPYSMFRAANDPKKGGNGNRLKEPWRITGMIVSGLSFPQTGVEVNTYVDYLTITQYGKPEFKK